MEGSCHCGAVRIAVSRPPADVTECSCSICRRYGELWAYYPRSEVSISGSVDDYAWGKKRVAFSRCVTCGSVLGWWPRGDYPECAVNARMLDGLDLAAVKRIIEDDASV